MNRFFLFCSTIALSASVSFAQTPLWRINCGGSQTTAGGAVFLADQAYVPGNGAGYVDGGTPSVSIGGADSGLLGWLDAPFDPVHIKARSGFSAYRFDVAPGPHIVRLHFAEVNLFDQGPGLRSFSLNLEGSPIVVDLDPSELVGWNYAIERCFETVVGADGVLDIEDPNAGTAQSLLNAVEVFSSPAAYPIPAPISHLAAKAGYHENILTWDSVNNPRVRNFRIERSSNAAGPWTVIDEQFHGPPRYLDRSAPIGIAQFYRVITENHAGHSSLAAGPVSSTALDTSASSLRAYELSVAPEDLAALSVNVLLSDEVPGTFTFDGISYPVMVRYRGASSRRAPKKSWKIKFDAPNKFEGRKELNLKAHFVDSSLVREASVLRMQRRADITAADHMPIHLEINGVFRGVFEQVEQVDEDFLSSIGRDRGGDIFKGGSNFRTLGSPGLYEDKYPKRTNKSTGHAELIALIELVNDSSTTLEDLADRFDLDSYLDYLAIVSFMSDGDQLAHNFLLLHDLDLDRWEWLTWDNDASFGASSLPLDWGTCLSGTCPPENQLNHLRDFVVLNDALRWRLVEKIKVLQTLEANLTVLGTEVAQQHAIVFDDAQRDIFKKGWEQDSLFLAAVQPLLTFITNRTSFLVGEFLTFQPSTVPTDVWINEFMASNETTISDNFGEFDDWIELYNASSNPKDVGGMYLTDDIGDPMQWQIPSGTTIAPLGHLLIWADKDLAQGPLHADFKLGGGGEEIALFDVDGSTLLDFYHYRPQFPDISEGRITDGVQWFAFTEIATPGVANVPSLNLPPKITFVQIENCTPDSSQAVEITCMVRDEGPLNPTDLAYAVNGGAFTTIPMVGAGIDRYTATIPAQPAGSTVEFYIRAEDAQMAFQTYPFGAPGNLEDYTVIGTNLGVLAINEFCADNDTIIADPQGQFEDYIELYNSTGAAFDLSNSFLTDDLCEPDKWQFPAGTTIAPGGTLLVWADNDADPGLHATFSLKKSGEQVGLFQDVGGSLVRLDSLSYSPQSADTPTGRLGNGGDNLFRLLTPTPDLSNLPQQGFSYGFQDRDGSNPILLSAQGSLKIGTNVTFTIDGSLPAAPGAVLISVAPVHMSSVLAPGISLVNPTASRIVRYTTDGAGDGTAVFAVPNVIQLVGMTLYSQAVTIGEGLSHGVAWTVDQ